MSIPKMANAMNYVDDDLVSGAVEYKRTRKKYSWIKWWAVAACLCLVVATGIIIDTSKNDVAPPAVADAAPMVYVNDTLYKQSTTQTFYTQLKEEFVYLGEIESETINDQNITDGIPNKNFQVNHSIVGSEVYQYGEKL